MSSSEPPSSPFQAATATAANCSHYLPPTARLFNSSPIQPRRCRVLLTKIALLLYTGEKFPTTEATTLFFGISKLFQNKDASLRQMVHLVIKELASSAEDVIMVTATIMKDTGGSTDSVYRPNAIRALCRIIDVRHTATHQRLLIPVWFGADIDSSRPLPSSLSSVL